MLTIFSNHYFFLLLYRYLCFLSKIIWKKKWRQSSFLCKWHSLLFEHTIPHKFCIFFWQCLTIWKNSHVGIYRITAFPSTNLIKCCPSQQGTPLFLTQKFELKKKLIFKEQFFFFKYTTQFSLNLNSGKGS